ncbi:MAG: diguanylate cyclase [Marinobacter sp.]|uniref:sensor domain-containing diguanylate cyclase n=1 Tax=Marinobacter sp. TaxID=50741 RepID=UPI00299EFCF5|nr:diguanylate cyclase [Marinobacter sp.]MDX1632996.1 diguanylate cyclase [Marinobacter sp.]
MAWSSPGSWLLLFLCLAAASVATADNRCDSTGAGPALDVTDARANLLDYVCYRVVTEDAGDSPAAVAPGEDSWQSADGRELVFSNSPATFWFSLTLTNPGPGAGVWFVKLSYAPLDQVDIWRGDTGQDPAISTGDQEPFDSRAVDYRYFLVPVTLEAGETTSITLRVKSSGAINVPLSLQRAETLVAQSNQLTLIHGLFYGALLIFALFNLVLFASSWRAYYFYNSFYMISMGLFLAAMGGFAFQYFWPQSPWFANASIPLFEALGTLAMVLFGRSFLEIGSDQPRLSRLLTLLAWISVVLLVLVFVLPYSRSIVYNTLFGIGVIGCLFVAGLFRWRQGYAPAKWYIISWSLMVAGAGIYALAAFGYLGNFIAREILMQAAIGGQVLLLNYAIVMRWRLLNERLLAVEHSAKHELEQRVGERTAQLRETMRALERANRQLAEMSTRDSLTGLHNRRHLDNLLPELCAESRRNGQPLTMVLMDADHFKQLNDTWGHGFGDDCLRRIAEVLNRHVRRPRDVIARFGGEEFAVMLPNTDLEGARHLANQILADMATTPLLAPDNATTHITLSAGAAELAPGEDEGSLFARADDALYRAKALGRNRTEMAATPSEPAI